MAKLRREVGFWGAVGRLRVRDLFSVEYLSSLAAGSAATIALMFLTPATTRHDIAGDFLALSAALVGVVFAGLALVVALMNEAYMRLLSETESGITAFLSPFMIGLGLQVAAVLSAITYRAFGALIPGGFEPWLFGISATLFVAGCLEVVVLARSVFMHARLRVQFQQVTQLEEERLKRSRSAGR